MFTNEWSENPMNEEKFGNIVQNGLTQNERCLKNEIYFWCFFRLSHPLGAHLVQYVRMAICKLWITVNDSIPKSINITTTLI